MKLLKMCLFFLTVVWSNSLTHFLDFPWHQCETFTDTFWYTKIATWSFILKLELGTTESKYELGIPSCCSSSPCMPAALLVTITFSSPRGQYCLSLSQVEKQKNVAGFFQSLIRHCVCFSLSLANAPKMWAKVRKTSSPVSQENWHAKMYI